MDKKKTNGLGLLPHSFKKIGLLVMALAILIPLALMLTFPAVLKENKEIGRLVSMNAIILGLLFIAIAREKIEDERTIMIRMKTMSFTFVWGVLMVVIQPFINLLFKDDSMVKADSIVFSMLFFYLLVYSWQKKAI